MAYQKQPQRTDMEPQDTAKDIYEDAPGEIVDGKESLKRWEDQAQVLSLRRDGMTLQEISVKIGRSYAVTRKLYKAGLKAMLDEPLSDLIKLETARLDRLEKLLISFTQAPEDGEWLDVGQTLQVVDRLIKLMERRAKMHGLDKQPDPGTATHSPVEVVLFKIPENGR